MSLFFWVILLYLFLLMMISIYKSFSVKSQEDFMVAGRSVSTYKLVGTLLCTWIGSGSLLAGAGLAARVGRSEEHTSELQSRGHLVCRLLLEKKKKIEEMRCNE